MGPLRDISACGVDSPGFDLCAVNDAHLAVRSRGLVHANGRIRPDSRAVYGKVQVCKERVAAAKSPPQTACEPLRASPLVHNTYRLGRANREAENVLESGSAPAAVGAERSLRPFSRWCKAKARAHGNGAEQGPGETGPVSGSQSGTPTLSDGCRAGRGTARATTPTRKTVKRGASEALQLPPKKMPRLRDGDEIPSGPLKCDVGRGPAKSPWDKEIGFAAGASWSLGPSELPVHQIVAPVGNGGRNCEARVQKTSLPHPSVRQDRSDGSNIAQGIRVPRRNSPQPARKHVQNWSTALARARGESALATASATRGRTVPARQPGDGLRPSVQSPAKKRPLQTLFNLPQPSLSQVMRSRKPRAGTRLVAMRVNQNGQPPSSSCHVCGGRAPPGGRVVCGNFGRTACKKVFCPSCAATFTGRRAAELARAAWVCTHCKGSCPRFATCRRDEACRRP